MKNKAWVYFGVALFCAGGAVSWFIGGMNEMRDRGWERAIQEEMPETKHVPVGESSPSGSGENTSEGNGASTF